MLGAHEDTVTLQTRTHSISFLPLETCKRKERTSISSRLGFSLKGSKSSENTPAFPPSGDTSHST